MKQYVQAIEQAQMRKNIPSFRAGDTVVVNVKVKEGSRERIQAFEGVVIARRNRGLNSAFTVRKISHGEGVERVFQLHSPLIAGITIKRHGDVRKAKLYYLRGLTGKSARIKENLSRGGKGSVDFDALAAAEAEAASAAQLSEEAAQAAVAEVPEVEPTAEAKTEQKTAEQPKEAQPEEKAEAKAVEAKPAAEADDQKTSSDEKS